LQLGLEGRVALVSGSSKGIGRAIAAALAAEGAHVAVNGRDEGDMESVVEEIRSAGGTAEAISADVSEASGCDKLVMETRSRLGEIDVLVNNAGSTGRIVGFEELTDEEWREVFELNVMSAVRLSRGVIGGMSDRGWGRIVNLGSESGLQPDPFMPHYNMTKAALINLTKSLSKAHGSDGVLVNTVSPATIRTPQIRTMLEDMAREQNVSVEEAERGFLSETRPHIVMERSGEPEEVAKAVVFLASEATSFITGSNYRVDGGSIAHQ
jgi:NAD(P)-dependent dehydrogenase (short-subunit alcohol dehydrogenase family)